MNTSARAWSLNHPGLRTGCLAIGELTQCERCVSEPITVQLDLKVKIDDVPIGLSLQRYSPFKFSCSKLWMKHIPEVTLHPSNLHRVLDINVRFPTRVLYFECHDHNCLNSKQNVCFL